MGRTFHKPDQDVLELCQRAGETLKGAGFVFHCASMRTEACYYHWPGRKGLLRVGAHRSKWKHEELGGVVARITFNGTCLSPAGMMRISDEKVEQMICQAIGRYFLNAPPEDSDG